MNVEVDGTATNTFDYGLSQYLQIFTNILHRLKVSVRKVFGGAKESVAAAPAAMPPHRRSAFSKDRLPQHSRRLAGVFLVLIRAGSLRVTSAESNCFASQQMLSLRIAGAGAARCRQCDGRYSGTCGSSIAPALMLYIIMTTLRH